MTRSGVLAASLLLAALAVPAAAAPRPPAAAARAQQPVDAALRGVDAEADIEVSARVETLDGDVVVDFDGATPRTLASNTKVLTTAAALLALDPEYRWTTRCLLDGGTLWLVGDGDPSLRHTADGDHAEAFLDALAEALRGAGRDALEGVVLDARAFPGPARPPGWPQEQWSYYYCAPVSALQVEGSRLTVTLRDGHARIRPALGGRLRVARTEPQSRVFGAWWGSKPDEELVVKGAQSGEEPVQVSVQDPLWLYGAWLQEGLERRGIAVGRLRRAEGEEPEPQVEPLLEHHSAWTLAEAVAVVNKDSDNQLAETLLCTLGRERGGEGTREAGLRALRAALEAAGIGVEGMAPVDGSGMSRGPEEADNSRASPAQLCAVLRRVAEEPVGRVLFLSLPVGGEDGSLRGRFRDASFRDGQVRAKTGWIKGASSLSGYLLAPDDTILVFSIVVNYRWDGKPRTNNARFKRMQEEFLADVMRSRAWQ